MSLFCCLREYFHFYNILCVTNHSNTTTTTNTVATTNNTTTTDYNYMYFGFKGM